MNDKDKKQLEEAIARVDDWKGAKITYERVTAGVTNPNYKVTVDGKSYFLKIPGAGTEAFIDRPNCHQANLIAAKVGIGPKVEYYFPDTHVEIFEWLEGYRMLNFWDPLKKDIFNAMADTVKKFNDEKEMKLPLKQTAFEQAFMMMRLARERGGYIPPEFPRMEYLAKTIEDAIMTAGIDYKPCHNDHYTANYMYNDETGDLRLIDWEYASMNDEGWDLAIPAGGHFFTEGMDILWCKRYYGDQYDEVKLARVKLYKILADIKWGFWAITQAAGAPIDFDFYYWYGTKIDRLRLFWMDPRFDSWINIVKGKSDFHH